jgi:hypothetical protein
MYYTALSKFSGVKLLDIYILRNSEQKTICTLHTFASGTSISETLGGILNIGTPVSFFDGAFPLRLFLYF